MSDPSPDVKAAAIADLMTGDEPAEVARRYKIKSGTVRMWKQRYVTSSQHPVTPVTPVTPVGEIVQRPTLEARKQRIAELILDLLAAKLEASQRLTAYLSDPAVLERYKFEELVNLNGYLDRTALTLGDRLAGAADPEPDAGDPPDLS